MNGLIRRIKIAEAVQRLERGVETDIREYAEGDTVILINHNDRLCVKAFNEGGHNYTLVDVIDLINHCKENLYIVDDDDHS